ARVRRAAQVPSSSSGSVLAGSDVAYAARIPTRRIMTVTINVGPRFPAHATSMGRVLLAGLDAAARARILDDVTFEPITAATISTRAALELELDRVARQGYAIVDQELEVGLRSIAAPIHDPA